ncbi:MAG: thiamine phosphate synthase [Gemmatimonadetes bacterium]|nr:thiamine phosphate synthase [Gemmatimonadota bacterium]NIU75873.1 thiamine phosphate synthase [Gammaproteobacteria bacterium]NIP80590.1 thiamine phosphate synthase [Gemmatimonadota bacterium]NIQ55671.1 thiamine phosphate synthase [Gemmatimonadota bacterium]NIX45505.1 thiamine phosphate synthase [Gemmatimonadota bacterium]
MRLPRLHLVTDDDVLADPAFRDRAGALIRTHGGRLALHLRSPAGDVRRLHELTAALLRGARRSGAPLLVNDRPELVLALGAAGVQLGRRSIPVQAARALLGEDRMIGYSAHGAEETVSAVSNGADFVLLGTIWATPSHPDGEGRGLDLVREAVTRADAPVLAIGGVTPERAREARNAGAHGVAVIRGVWHASDPTAAAAAYLDVMEDEGP